MRIYKVGGAVRDELLGLEPTDNDWVVVGSTPKQMLSMGYKQVGKDFPVFLHPDTKEEYALARKERSTGPGHTAFNFSYSPNVTLEEDLSRRDITINAIAMDDAGNLIDPFNGKGDIENRIIRHVSDAFIEDPLRVLRVARFYTKLYQFNFVIDPLTRDLMDDLFPSIKHLPGERIWQETEKVLHMENPIPYFELIYNYFRFRDESNIFNNYFNNTRIAEIYRHCFSSCDYRGYSEIDFNPALETPESWWAIIGKEMKERVFLDHLNERLKVPKSFKRMSELVYDFRENYFKKYSELCFEDKVDNLFQCLEKMQPSKNLSFAISVTFLAAHNILGGDIRQWEYFLQRYSEILPTDEEKKLDGSQIQEILKERKIRFIEEEIKKDLD
tara:strand:- start:12 stop:1169 length:1158 start_codon:yes stop_codon:yes gene_type:complete